MKYLIIIKYACTYIDHRLEATNQCGCTYINYRRETTNQCGQSN